MISRVFVIFGKNFWKWIRLFVFIIFVLWGKRFDLKKFLVEFDIRF